MSTRTRIEPMAQTIQLLIAQDLSPAAQSAAHAEFHRETVTDAEPGNARAIGRTPEHVSFVDGRQSEQLELVKAVGGKIVTEFELIIAALKFIGRELSLHSPVGKTRKYIRSHRLLIDDREVDVNAIGSLKQHELNAVSEFVFVPTVNYARQLEYGWSKQAPQGVYQVVAKLARDQGFGGFLDIRFGWFTLVGLAESKPEKKARPNAPRDMRQPAVIVKWK